MAVRSGQEWVIPFHEVKQAIELAGERLIAVLGVELLRILENGLGVEGYTVYALDFQGDWPTFVAENNAVALRFIEDNPRGQGYGYILTTTSETEFRHLRDHI